MKTILIGGFLFFVSFILSAQDFEVIQITDGNFDARNPAINQAYFNYNFVIYFELHIAGSSNIYYLQYDHSSNTFSDTIPLTTGSFSRLNPATDNFGGVVYQTNQNGNWDLATRRYNGNGYSDELLLTNSVEDEYNPVDINIHTWNSGDSIDILYQTDDMIKYLSLNGNIINTETVFENDSDYTYHSYTGTFYSNHPGGFPRTGLHVVAVKEYNDGSKELTTRYRDFNGIWEDEKVLLDSSDCSNPGFQVLDFFILLAFEDTLNGERKLFYYEDWDNSKNLNEMDFPYEGSHSNFTSEVSYVVTAENNPSEIFFYNPYSYTINNNSETRIRLNQHEYGVFIPDTLYKLNRNETNIDIGSFGLDEGGEVFFTVWEDSVSDNVHLFARKHIMPIGNVEDESNLTDFSLSQNYPNPFNPSTKISWQSSVPGQQSIKVYDILGNEVATLVDEYKPAGSYEVEFDGSDLTSGVYFYQLRIYGYSFVRKMLLLK